MQEPTHRVFQFNYARTKQRDVARNVHILIPIEVEAREVRTIWSNAIRFTADGLDLPNGDKALEKVMTENPDWVLVKWGGSVGYEADLASDAPEA